MRPAGRNTIAASGTGTADTTGPAVAITYPADNATVTSASLTVRGTASDSGLGNNGVSSVTVNGVSASGGTASGANTANWSATITLSPGANTITVVGKDTLNNSTQQQIHVNTQNQWWPPSVSVQPPSPSSANNISITLAGDWPYVGYPTNSADTQSTYPTITQNGSDIYVNIYRFNSGLIVPGDTSWSVTGNLDPPAGRHVPCLCRAQGLGRTWRRHHDRTRS